ncbi:tectonic-2-like [Styela clava]
MFFSLCIVCLITGFSNGQTSGTNPAYENIAPCGCDLTLNQYDNNCCCDPDITNEGNISNCISGPYGGNFMTFDDRICRFNQSFTPDWFPFLCIQFLNSPDLGLYYYPSIAPGSTVTVSSVQYNYAEVISTSVCGQSITHTYGVAIGAKSSGVDTCLRLPQNSISGNCLSSPVRYLVDTTASCDTTTSEILCSAGTKLDAAYYTSFSIGNVVASVSYFCSRTINDPLYVKTNLGSTSTNTESLFQQTSLTTDPTTCNYAAPLFSSAGSSCQNSVASVSYTITWNGTNITAFDVAVTLVNVSLTTTDLVSSGSGPNFVLAQKFTTTYVPSTSTNAVAQSGDPGYEYGLPIISAEDTGATEVNGTTQLSVWSSTSSGLCADASLTQPLFGYDSVSGCTLVFSYQNCTQLRALVEAEQLKLLSANRVSRFGNPSNTASSVDWIAVINNITDFVEENVTAGQCEGIPSHVVLEILWAKTGEGNNVDIREIVGARVDLVRETWEIRCVEGETNCEFYTYPIYSTVTFTEVPPQATTPLTLYEINRNDTCKRDATCWPELLLPIQPEFFYLYDLTTADTLRSYNYGWALLVTFFSVAAAVVPAHWSSVGRYLKQVLPL